MSSIYTSDIYSVQSLYGNEKGNSITIIIIIIIREVKVN